MIIDFTKSIFYVENYGFDVPTDAITLAYDELFTNCFLAYMDLLSKGFHKRIEYKTLDIDILNTLVIYGYLREHDGIYYFTPNPNVDDECSPKKITRLDDLQYIHDKVRQNVNPFATLKSLSNKKFGEEWSENYVRAHTPNLIRDNGTGHDALTKSGEKWEIKSARLPQKDICFNQCHLGGCDKFLFVLYNCETGEEQIYLVPAIDIRKNFHYSAQHIREGKETAECVSIKYNGNKEVLENHYRIANWEELNKMAGE